MTVASSDTTLGHIAYVLRANPVTLIAFGLFGGLIFTAVFGPLLVPYDPLASNAARALDPPSWAHPFGTD
ncbi:MAG: ABC transporter permease, partial [Pseudomonadota bacterium]